MCTKFFVQLSKKLDFNNIAKLLLIPAVYLTLMGFDFTKGIIIGMLLYSLNNDIKKFGLSRMIWFPENREVRQLEDLIQQGDLDAIKEIAL